MATKRKLPESVEMAVAETRARLRTIYGNRLVQVILFGSYARGDHGPGSDIDLLILLDRIEDPNAERDRYLPVVYDISLKYDVALSIIPLASNVYLSEQTPLILNVRREGIPA